MPHKYRRPFSGHSICIELPYDMYIMHLCFDHHVCEHGVSYGRLFINSAASFLHRQLPYWTLDMNTIYTTQHIHLRYGYSLIFHHPTPGIAVIDGGGRCGY